jgi:hypothetical protein
MKRSAFAIALAVMVFSFFLYIGCGEEPYSGVYKTNEQPTVRITNGPAEGDSIEYRIHFYWLGYDPDGTIDYYEYVLSEGDPIGFNPEDTAGANKWKRINGSDTVLRVIADEYDDNVKINNNLYGKYKKTHTFFIRAVDNRGTRSAPAYRSFTAWTLAPYVYIQTPVNPNPTSSQVLNPITVFSWEGKDPIDSPWNTQDVDSIRYMWGVWSADVLADLNANPDKYERKWSPWFSYEAPGDTGTSTILGDDEVLKLGFFYYFTVQAMDEAGAVTSVFDERMNFRHFLIMKPTGPLLNIREYHLGDYKFLGMNQGAAVAYLPAGFPIDLSWSGDASAYGGVVSTFRYGWDVSDINKDDEWDVLPSPLIITAPTRKWYSGVHTLFVEATDNLGVKTLGRLEINIVPLTMERNLLWVDDFFSSHFNQYYYSFPTELEHDEFWLDMCSRAEGFLPERDVYDTGEHTFLPPDFRILWNYKNIIWTYTSEDRVSTWLEVIKFVPESMAGWYPEHVINYLRIFLKMGGHLWSLGKSDKDGGLASCLLYRHYRIFPNYLKCESAGLQTGCAGDTSGVFSFAYADYCVTVLDKVGPPFRRDGDMPSRNTDWDAMTYAISDRTDPYTLAHPDLPETLTLWNEVTKPGRFFDPQVRGFTYLEVYNPEYWMRIRNIKKRSCFHPMYRIRTRQTKSQVDYQVIGFWVTRYENVRADVPGAIPALSVHLGFPLWFFNRTQAHKIADAVFKEWGISAMD